MALDFDKEEIEKEWEKLKKKLASDFAGKELTLEAILFLIGVREMGLIPKNFSKEEKQDLMHVATCTLLSEPFANHYKLTGKNERGWPVFELVEPMPNLNLSEQEILLKHQIINYFQTIN